MEKHIFLFGIIGQDVHEAAILKDIAQAKEQKAEVLVVQISSPGGYVYSGRAIYNALKTSGIPVRVEIIGQAFSIASYIAMAGDEILIAEKAEMMIHQAWGKVEGTASEMRKSADQLEEMSKEIYSTYVARGADSNIIKSFFDTEKVLNAQEAIDAGLATGMLQPMKAVAYFEDTQKTNKKDEMEKGTIDKILDEVKALGKRLSGKAKNASVTADDGTVLYFDGDVIAVDTPVFADEAMTEAAEPGTYTEGTTTYTVAGGIVTEISEASSEAEEEMAALKAELEAKTAELDSVKAEVEALKASNEAEKAELNKELNSIKNVLIQEKVNIDRKAEKDTKPKFETVAQKMQRLAKEAHNREQN